MCLHGDDIKRKNTARSAAQSIEEGDVAPYYHFFRLFIQADRRVIRAVVLTRSTGAMDVHFVVAVDVDCVGTSKMACTCRPDGCLTKPATTLFVADMIRTVSKIDTDGGLFCRWRHNTS